MDTERQIVIREEMRVRGCGLNMKETNSHHDRGYTLIYGCMASTHHLHFLFRQRFDSRICVTASLPIRPCPPKSVNV